jgi:hypothetical protein
MVDDLTGAELRLQTLDEEVLVPLCIELVGGIAPGLIGLRGRTRA